MIDVVLTPERFVGVNLRELARGKPCMVRLPGCDGGGPTTVLAHYRLAGYAGVGMKPIDEMAAWACASCHAIIDGVDDRLKWTRDQVRLAHAEGVMRTLAETKKLA
jgi:predicted ATPase